MSTAETGGALPKASEVRTAGTAKANAMHVRADAWRTARELLTGPDAPDWAEGVDPYHVLALARYLDGQKLS